MHWQDTFIHRTFVLINTPVTTTADDQADVAAVVAALLHWAPLHWLSQLGTACQHGLHAAVPVPSVATLPRLLVTQSSLAHVYHWGALIQTGRAGIPEQILYDGAHLQKLGAEVRLPGEGAPWQWPQVLHIELQQCLYPVRLCKGVVL